MKLDKSLLVYVPEYFCRSCNFSMLKQRSNGKYLVYITVWGVELQFVHLAPVCINPAYFDLIGHPPQTLWHWWVLRWGVSYMICSLGFLSLQAAPKYI